MGMLLPWRFVRQGFVPRDQDFKEVSSRILEIARRERVFKAVAFVGSLKRGDLNPRSDLDLILVAHDRHVDFAQVLEREFQRLSLERTIPLDSRLWRSSDARRGRHSYGPSYLETFPTKPDQFSVGVSLADCFRVPHSSVQVEMTERLVHKLHSTRTRAGIFLARYASDSEMIERWLESSWGRVVRPMRVHITVGRRTLWWLHGSLSDDGKAAVIRQFLAEPELSALHNDYQHLVNLDNEYDEFLTSCILDGRECRVGYLQKVGNLLTENFRVSLRLLQNILALMKGRATQAA